MAGVDSRLAVDLAEELLILQSPDMRLGISDQNSTRRGTNEGHRWWIQIHPHLVALLRRGDPRRH